MTIGKKDINRIESTDFVDIGGRRFRVMRQISNTELQIQTSGATSPARRLAEDGDGETDVTFSVVREYYFYRLADFTGEGAAVENQKDKVFVEFNTLKLSVNLGEKRLGDHGTIVADIAYITGTAKDRYEVSSISDNTLNFTEDIVYRDHTPDFSRTVSLAGVLEFSTYSVGKKIIAARIPTTDGTPSYYLTRVSNVPTRGIPMLGTHLGIGHDVMSPDKWWRKKREGDRWDNANRHKNVFLPQSSRITQFSKAILYDLGYPISGYPTK